MMFSDTELDLHMNELENITTEDIITELLNTVEIQTTTIELLKKVRKIEIKLKTL